MDIGIDVKGEQIHGYCLFTQISLKSTTDPKKQPGHLILVLRVEDRKSGKRFENWGKRIILFHEWL